jgi:hypothetical protein
MSVGDVYPYQIKPDWLYGILQPQFQARAEPNFAWKSCVSALMGLPALRAAWTMSSIGPVATDFCRDVSGGGNHLINNSLNVQFGYDDLIPSAYFVAASANDYLYRADGGVGQWADIIGTETYIPSTQRGLTFGGWFYVDSDTGSTQVLIGKVSGGGANRSYQINVNTATLLPAFNTALVAVEYVVTGTAGTTGAVPLDTWSFLCARFDPSTEMRIWLNNNSNVLLVVPATINDTGADFTIGATAVPGNWFDGRASLCFLCAAALSDSIILQFYHQTRAMYGV